MTLRQNLNATLALTKASLLMYFRDFTAVFFTLVFPVIFLVVFGLIAARGDSQYSIAIFNQSGTALSKDFEKSLDTNKAFDRKSDAGDLDAAKQKLKKDDLTFVVVIPRDFGVKDAQGKIKPVSVQGYYNQGSQGGGAAAQAVVEQTLQQFNAHFVPQPAPVFKLAVSGVQSANLKGIDYLLPGIIGFSLMSLGLFGVANGFVSLKASGALRRLHVAPVKPAAFLVGQTITRLVMGFLSVAIMYVIGVTAFHFHMHGNPIYFLFIAALGVLLFQTIGFAVAGWAKNENQAAPIANIVFFPLLFLSGTFFPRDSFPAWLKPISDYIPLTYLSDGLRQVANNAAGITQLKTNIIGMLVWLVISFVIAVKVFRWE